MPLLAIQDVLKHTTLSRAVWYRLVKAGIAPKPIRIGMRRVAWRSDDVDAFITSRVEK